MADLAVQSAAPWVEELRRLINRRRQRRRRLALAALIGSTATPVTASILWAPPVVLVWNASASAPTGLYRLRPGALVRPGDMVIAWTPEPVRQLAARRRYLPVNVPLVKRVVASAGDRVCASGEAISINGKRVALRHESDAAGRRMPWWNGCRQLGGQEYFLLMDSPASFDGRYFGMTRSSDVLGLAQLLWATPVKGSNNG